MIPYFQDLFNRILFDKTWPERAFRAGMVGFGQLYGSGLLSSAKHPTLGILITAAALLIPAGQKNPKTTA